MDNSKENNFEELEKLKIIINEQYKNSYIPYEDIKKTLDEIVDIHKEKNKTNIDAKNIKRMILKYLFKIDGIDNLYTFKWGDDTRKKYEYTTNTGYRIEKHTGKEYEPFGTQWIHDEQYDDDIDDIILRRTKQYEKIRKIEVPEQCSPEWFKMRENKLTASDIGSILNMNNYTQPYEILIKKITPDKFEPNKYCYHGKKYESIACMIYKYRMNVSVDDFGLIEHPIFNYIGASPDGICNKYKYNDTNLSKYVGRMLEIKCVSTRKINMSGEIKGHICPLHYWAQVQIQLECCNLDECDFWQVNITEYNNRSAFIQDTDPAEPFRSKKTKFEKGCIIQLLPKNKYYTDYNTTVYSCSSFIYPDKIEMTPHECDIWILNKLENLKETHPDCVFDRIIYWRLNESKNALIKRDEEWFDSSLDKLYTFYNHILFYKKNRDKIEELLEFININGNNNKKIMNYIENVTSDQ